MACVLLASQSNARMASMLTPNEVAPISEVCGVHLDTCLGQVHPSFEKAVTHHGSSHSDLVISTGMYTGFLLYPVLALKPIFP